MIHHHLALDDLTGHHYRVTLRIPRPASRQRVALPVWIPGSYLVREFARHVSALEARQGGEARVVEALDKQSWQVACAGTAALELSYRVYAFDSSVRGAWLDDARGFFNGTAVFMRVPGRQAQPQRVTLGPLPAGWQVATSMPALHRAAARPSTGRSLHSYQAADYDELVDHPFELGPFWRGEVEVGGVPHALVLSGGWPRLDAARLLAQTARLCAQVQAFWQGAAGDAEVSAAPKPDLPAVPVAAEAGAGAAVPFARYLFLLNVRGEGGGGLEHRASCALLAARRDLPVQGVEPSSEGQIGLLGLICHEYFHAWHVKRLKPVELARIDYSRENPTPLLWCFEGFTTYYEDLLLRRAGLVDATTYLGRLAKVIETVARTPGRRVQSVAGASFDAWIKLYRADENTPNATVNYYDKGCLVALALDLSLRAQGHSLDAVMRWLWRAGGAAQAGRSGQGGLVAEADLLAALQQVAGEAAMPRLRSQLSAWVHGTDELPLAELLAAVGVDWQQAPAGLAASLGLRLAEGPVSGCTVRQVLAGSAAQAAGVAAGDELLAVDGWRIRRLDEAEAWTAPGDTLSLLLVRDQRVLSRVVQRPTLAATAGRVQLALASAPTPEALARRRAWIDA